MRHVSSACPECHTAIARLGAAIAKGALKDFINLHEDEPFAAELISRQYVRKLAEEGQATCTEYGRSCGTLQGAHDVERRKVMTNKRIHVSAIVLLIAAIIIDMHNNGLCPLSCASAAPVPVRATKITGSFMVRGSVAAWQRGNGQRVPGTGYRIQGTVHGVVVDLKTTLRRLSQVLALPVKYATRSRRVYNCVRLCTVVCVPLCLCLQMLIDYTVRDEIITSN